MEFNQEIFKGKDLSSLFKDIYENSKAKEKQIKELIIQLKDMVNEPGDAILIVPLIQGYLEVAVKNDDALIKMANIVQRSINAKGQVETELLSEKDKELLFEQIRSIDIPKLPASA
jgi:hypothetical protein